MLVLHFRSFANISTTDKHRPKSWTNLILGESSEKKTSEQTYEFLLFEMWLFEITAKSEKNEQIKKLR